MARFLPYGCDIAQTAQGKAFVDAFAKATGADVAASTDTTGAARYKGNWKLEYQYGAIETTAMTTLSYQGVLLTVDLSGTDLLKFGTPAYVTGTGNGALTEGAVYKYTNVATVNGIQIDAYVTIADLVDATINSIDDLNPIGSASYTLTRANGTTYTVAEVDLFAPSIKTMKAEGRVDFDVAFTDKDGTPLTLLNFYNNSIDVDSPEFVEYGGFQSYTLATPAN